MNRPANSPMSSPVTPMGTPTGGNHRKVGPVVATLVVVLMLIIAALYLFAARVNKEPVPTDNSVTSAGNGASVATPAPSVPAVTDTQNDPASLQSDLNVSTQNLDQQNF